MCTLAQEPISDQQEMQDVETAPQAAAPDEPASMRPHAEAEASGGQNVSGSWVTGRKNAFAMLLSSSKKSTTVAEKPVSPG